MSLPPSSAFDFAGPHPTEGRASLHVRENDGAEEMSVVDVVMSSSVISPRPVSPTPQVVMVPAPEQRHRSLSGSLGAAPDTSARVGTAAAAAAAGTPTSSGAAAANTQLRALHAAATTASGSHEPDAVEDGALRFQATDVGSFLHEVPQWTEEFAPDAANEAVVRSTSLVEGRHPAVEAALEQCSARGAAAPVAAPSNSNSTAAVKTAAAAVTRAVAVVDDEDEVTRNIRAALLSVEDPVRLQRLGDQLRRFFAARALQDVVALAPYRMGARWNAPVIEVLTPDEMAEFDGPMYPSLGLDAATAADPHGLHSRSAVAAVRTNSKCASAHHTIADGVVVRIGRVQIQIHVLSFFVRIALLCLFAYFIWAVYQGTPHFQRGGYVFDAMWLLVVASVGGKALARFVRLPTMIGVLIVAIVWCNIPYYGYMTSGVAPILQTTASRVSSAFAIVRAGMSLNPVAVRKAGIAVLLIAMLPLALETVVHGCVAMGLFGDYSNDIWPFLQASLAAPTSAALVIPTVMQLRKLGHRGTRGLPFVLTVGCGPETAFGMWAIAFMDSLLFLKPGQSIGVAVGTVIPKLLAGIAVGLGLAVIWDFLCVFILLNEARPYTRHGAFWLRHNKAAGRLSWVGLILGACALIYGSFEINEPASGVWACFAFGVGVNILLWTRVTSPFSADSKNPLAVYIRHTPLAPVAVTDLQHALSQLSATCWEYILMPCLFALTVTGVKLTEVFKGDFLWRALICLVCGALARVVGVCVATASLPMTWPERVFTGFVFCARASVQLAIGPIALGEINKGKFVTYNGGVDANPLALEKQIATRIMNVAILSSLLFAPFATFILSRFGPHVMLTEEQWEERERQRASEVKDTPAPSAVVAATTSNDDDGVAAVMVPPVSALPAMPPRTDTPIDLGSDELVQSGDALVGNRQGGGGDAPQRLTWSAYSNAHALSSSTGSTASTESVPLGQPLVVSVELDATRSKEK